MEFILKSENIGDYLEETEIINFRSPSIQAKIVEFQMLGKNKQEWAQFAFNFVRDEIQHSFDKECDIVTVSASEALEKGQGICFAKAHLLAALLRGMGIPTGFCYQRVTRKGTPDSGYAVHGLNAIYFEDIDTWFRVDPRGDKPGVHSEFSIHREILAYPIRMELDEIDYPFIFSVPLESVISSMHESIDYKELFIKRPELIQD